MPGQTVDPELLGLLSRGIALVRELQGTVEEMESLGLSDLSLDFSSLNSIGDLVEELQTALSTLEQS